MSRFFEFEVGNKLKIFGLGHILFIFLSIVISILFFKFRKQIRYNTKRVLIERVFGIIIMSHEFFYIYYKLSNEFRFIEVFSIYWCFLTTFLISITFIFQTKKFVTLIIYLFVGSTIPLIIPIIDYSFDRYFGWAYFLAHHIIFISAVYILTIYKIRITTSNFIKSYYLLLLYVIYSLILYFLFSIDNLHIYNNSLGSIPILSKIMRIDIALYTMLIIIFYMMYIFVITYLITSRKTKEIK